MKIYLDDIRNPLLYQGYDESWVIVRTDNEFKRIVLDNKDNIEVISFDNDLGEGLIEGYELLKWMANVEGIIFNHVIVHSDNNVAQENISIFAKNYFEFLLSEGLITDYKVEKKMAMHNFK